MWLILALITAVGWAVGAALTKKAVGEMPKQLVYFSNAFFFLAAWLVYRQIQGGFVWDLTAFLLAAGPGIGFVYVLQAFSHADVSLVNAIGSINPAITALLAVSFLGEKLSGLQWSLIILVVVGAMVMSLSKQGKIKKINWLWWGLGFGLLSGLNNFFSKLGITRSETVSFSLMVAFWQMGIALLWLVLTKQFGKIKSLFKKERRLGLAATGIYNLGSLAFFLALGAGKASLVMPVVTLYVPLLLILAAWWLKEKMNLRQKIGAGIIIVSVIILSVI